MAWSPDGSQIAYIARSEEARFAEVLPRIAQDSKVRLREVVAADESLESVFSYLVEN